MKKTILALLFSVLCVVTGLFISPVAFAETVDSGTCGDNLTWTLESDGLLTISGNGVIPDYNYEESRLTPWSGNSNEITSVTVGEEIYGIGDQAFANLPNLFSVHLPEGIRYIGSGAFENAVSLSEIQLPAGLQDLGAFSFYGCTALNSIGLPSSLHELQHSTFMGCTGLEAVELPQWLESVGVGCFTGCENLTNVYYPGTEIGAQFIYYANGNDALLAAAWTFGSADISTDIDWNVVEGVLTISGNGVIPDYNYEESRLTPWSGNSNEITSVTVGEGIYGIGDQAFANLPNLVSAHLPEGIRYIGSGAFENAVSLSAIQLPAGLQDLGAFSFYGCSALNSISLPSSLHELQHSTFMGCSGLEAVELPQWLESVGVGCFTGCENLTTVYYPGTAIGAEFIYFANGNDALLAAAWTYGNQNTPGAYTFTSFEEFKELVNGEQSVDTNRFANPTLIYTGTGPFVFSEDLDCRYKVVRFNNQEIQIPAGSEITIQNAGLQDIGGLSGGTIRLQKWFWLTASKQYYEPSWIDHLIFDEESYGSVSLYMDVDTDEAFENALEDSPSDEHFYQDLTITGSVHTQRDLSTQSRITLYIQGDLTIAHSLRLTDENSEVYVSGNLSIDNGGTLSAFGLNIQDTGELLVSEDAEAHCNYLGNIGTLVINGNMTVDGYLYIENAIYNRVNGSISIPTDAYYGSTRPVFEFGETGKMYISCEIFDESNLSWQAERFDHADPGHIMLNMIVSSPLTLTNDFVLTEDEALLVHGAGIAEGDLTIQNPATLTVNPGAQLEVSGTDVHIDGSLINHGSLKLTPYLDESGNRHGSRLVLGETGIYRGDVTWVFESYDDVLRLPADVQSIEAEALAGTAASVVEIPVSCIAVAEDAFVGCENLVYIVNHSNAAMIAPEGVAVLMD